MCVPCRWQIARHWQNQDNYLARYSSPDLTKEDFPEWEDILMQPGDMLYLPRGEKHGPSKQDISLWPSLAIVHDIHLCRFFLNINSHCVAVLAAHKLSVMRRSDTPGASRAWAVIAAPDNIGQSAEHVGRLPRACPSTGRPHCQRGSPRDEAELAIPFHTLHGASSPKATDSASSCIPRFI